MASLWIPQHCCGIGHSICRKVDCHRLVLIFSFRRDQNEEAESSSLRIKTGGGMDVYGLLITKDDHEAFGDWCRDQLPLYEHVVCLDGSGSDETARQARHFSGRLIYVHECDFEIPSKRNHA